MGDEQRLKRIKRLFYKLRQETFENGVRKQRLLEQYYLSQMQDAEIDPATDKQLNYLYILGCEPWLPISKTVANKLIKMVKNPLNKEYTIIHCPEDQ